MTSDEGHVIEFVQLNGFDDYEILNDFPFTIRKKANHKIVHQSLFNNGYLYVNLNCKPYLLHRLIALQFLENDDPIINDIIDHVNHDRTDNHLHNLRWCSSSDNSKNKSSHKGVDYEYVDDIPDDAMIVDFYETRTEYHAFESYYFYNDEFYFFNGIKYRILHVNYNKSGNAFVSMRDDENRLVSVYYTKFKRQHDLI